MTHLSFRRAFALMVLATAVLISAGCGSEEETRDQEPSKQTAGKRDSDKPPRAPEPAKAPSSEEKPTGRVVSIGNAPEGIAADPDTGLVAVALRKPNELALVDGESGEITRRVELPGSARHLDLAAPGGPVLVPAEGSDSLVQVGLPDGEIVSETPVGDFPHNAAATRNGRILVANEKETTASVIEDGRELKKIETPLQPGGVAVTKNGLAGIVGVRGLIMEVFEADTLKSVDRVDAGEGPTHVRAGPENRFYVTDTRGDAVLIYGTSPELERIGRVSLPGSPYGIAIDLQRDQLWVTLTAKQQVVRFALEGDSLREISRYPTVRQPNTVAVDPNSGRVFIASRAEDQLQILDPR